MHIDTQALINWLRARAEADLTADRVVEAKIDRDRAEDAYQAASEALLAALESVSGAEVSMTASTIEIHDSKRTLLVHLDGRVETVTTETKKTGANRDTE